jgi:hypothetical protein
VINYLITGGCSFSTSTDDASWVNELTSHLQESNNKLTYEHTGYYSQGQELIQKKVMLAAMEALDQGIDPETILIAVMWSGTDRKAWYIDNPRIIQDVVRGMPKFNGGMSRQFLDLKNNVSPNKGTFKTFSGSEFDYSAEGGWYFTVNGSDCQLGFVQQHYMLDQFAGGVGKVHSSLENIIMLQNFCKLHGIKLVQQFFMDLVFQDIVSRKDHQMVKYLYKQLDFDSIIKDGMFDYLHPFIGVDRDKSRDLSHKERLDMDAGRQYFSTDGFHPGKLGRDIWCTEILFPFISKKLYEI